MPRRKRRPPALSRMTAPQREAYERTLHAVGLMRRERKSLTVAAREAGTRPVTVRRLTGQALTRVHGRWKAKPTDRLERRLLFYDEKGAVFVTTRSSTSASRIGDYHNAIKEYLETGDRSKLTTFEGRWVVDARRKRRRFVTDPSVIGTLARASVFGFESIY